MTAIVSNGLKDCSHLTIVPVISSFDREGNVLPLYVRLEGQPFKIYNPYVCESNTRILTFRCEIITNNMVRNIKLKYFVHDLVWCLKK